MESGFLFVAKIFWSVICRVVVDRVSDVGGAVHEFVIVAALIVAVVGTIVEQQRRYQWVEEDKESQ